MPQPAFHIALFTRYPVAGMAKTRLIPELGADGAAALQAEMTGVVVRAVRAACALVPRTRADIWLTGASPAAGRALWELPCVAQGEGSLGERMARAIVSAHRGGATVAAVVGGDCPQLTGALIAEMLARAAESGGAIILARDGGYCALALRRDDPSRITRAFAEIEWGTDTVGREQIERLAQLGIGCEVVGEPLSDIDTPPDLAAWHTVRAAWHDTCDRVSVIVPTLNESARIGQVVAGLLRSNPERVEVIVADGGSTDGTAEIARAAGATVVLADRGRGPQLNAGAARATAPAVLFLHADTTLPAGWLDTVCARLDRETDALGAFSLAFDVDGGGSAGGSRSLRVVQIGANLRARVLRLPYGDQAIFCRRALFETLGGFAPLPFMEDYELVRRTGRSFPIRIERDAATTSARRYRERGVWRTAWRNVRTVWRYESGTPVERLAPRD